MLSRTLKEWEAETCYSVRSLLSQRGFSRTQRRAQTLRPPFPAWRQLDRGRLRAPWTAPARPPARLILIGSLQKDAEPGLLEMMITRQGFSDAFALHDDEGDAIGERRRSCRRMRISLLGFSVGVVIVLRGKITGKRRDGPRLLEKKLLERLTIRGVRFDRDSDACTFRQGRAVGWHDHAISNDTF
jgi:hypothetical protein